MKLSNVKSNLIEGKHFFNHSHYSNNDIAPSSSCKVTAMLSARFNHVPNDPRHKGLRIILDALTKSNLSFKTKTKNGKYRYMRWQVPSDPTRFLTTNKHLDMVPFPKEDVTKNRKRKSEEDHNPPPPSSNSTPSPSTQNDDSESPPPSSSASAADVLESDATEEEVFHKINYLFKATRSNDALKNEVGTCIANICRGKAADDDNEETINYLIPPPASDDSSKEQAKMILDIYNKSNSGSDFMTFVLHLRALCLFFTVKNNPNAAEKDHEEGFRLLFDEPADYEAAKRAYDHGERMMKLIQLFGFSILYLPSIFSIPLVAVDRSYSVLSKIARNNWMIGLEDKFQKIGLGDGDKLKSHHMPLILQELSLQLNGDQPLILPFDLQEIISPPEVTIKQEEEEIKPGLL